MPAQYLVEEAKVRDYLLNPYHAEGGPKCAFLLSVGFSIEDPSTLMRALARHHAFARITRSVTMPFGRRIHFEGPFPRPGGEFANVRTVWQVDRDAPAGAARFITLKPLPKLRSGA